jgi:hypothetical protein
MEIRTQDKYQKRQSERINQKIKVLTNRLDFQKDIHFLRNKWEIPTDGLKNDDDYEEWSTTLLEKTDEYYDKNWPKEKKEIITLREKGKYDEANEIKNKINKLTPINEFGDDIWVMIINYRLSPRWYEGIKRYTLYNDSKNMGIPAGATVLNNWDHGIPIVSIQFDRDTTLEDLKRAWSWARKMYKGGVFHKFQPIKKFDRDKRAYELEKEGKDWEEIAGIIEKEFNDDLDYNEINIAINRYKKRLNINQA